MIFSITGSHPVMTFHLLLELRKVPVTTFQKKLFQFFEHTKMECLGSKLMLQVHPTLPTGQPRGTTLIPNIAANKNINASTNIMFPPCKNDISDYWPPPLWYLSFITGVKEGSSYHFSKKTFSIFWTYQDGVPRKQTHASGTSHPANGSTQRYNLDTEYCCEQEY